MISSTEYMTINTKTRRAFVIYSVLDIILVFHS